MRFLSKTCSNLHSHQHCLWARHLPRTLGRTWCYPSAEVLLVWCTYGHVLSQLFGVPWTAAHQAPLSTGFSRQEYCSGLPCLQGNLSSLGIKPGPPTFPADSLALIHQGSLTLMSTCLLFEISFASQVHQNRKEALSPIKCLIRANILSLLKFKGGINYLLFRCF